MVILQKWKKPKLVNKYTVYVRKKNQMIKIQHNRLYTWTNKWFDDILWIFKQVSPKYTKLNSSVIVLSENKQPWFIFNFFSNINDPYLR